MLSKALLVIQRADPSGFDFYLGKRACVRQGQLRMGTLLLNVKS